eukprot:7305792-Heterocapsa_arctica.AAC.1
MDDGTPPVYAEDNPPLMPMEVDVEPGEVVPQLQQVRVHRPGDDLIGGEGDVPEEFMRTVSPHIRRMVRTAHRNLGYPTTETLLR